jgi:hypothetical protein
MMSAAGYVRVVHRRAPAPTAERVTNAERDVEPRPRGRRRLPRQACRGLERVLERSSWRIPPHWGRLPGAASAAMALARLEASVLALRHAQQARPERASCRPTEADTRGSQTGRLAGPRTEGPPGAARMARGSCSLGSSWSHSHRSRRSEYTRMPPPAPASVVLLPRSAEAWQTLQRPGPSPAPPNTRRRA